MTCLLSMQTEGVLAGAPLMVLKWFHISLSKDFVTTAVRVRGLQSFNPWIESLLGAGMVALLWQSEHGEDGQLLNTDIQEGWNLKI